MTDGNDPGAVFRSVLLSGGLPAHVVEGIMMNARDESGFDPTAVGDSGNALGILQWSGPRKAALERFAAAQGGDPRDPAIQARFTLYELQVSERAALDRVMATKTAGEAGAAFVSHYERPAEVHRARREAAYLGGGMADDGAGRMDRNAGRLAWAYANGRMTPEDAAIYERGMAEGVFPTAVRKDPLEVYAETAMRQQRPMQAVAFGGGPVQNAMDVRPGSAFGGKPSWR